MSGNFHISLLFLLQAYYIRIYMHDLRVIAAWEVRAVEPGEVQAPQTLAH